MKLKPGMKKKLYNVHIQPDADGILKNSMNIVYIGDC